MPSISICSATYQECLEHKRQSLSEEVTSGNFLCIIYNLLQRLLQHSKSYCGIIFNSTINDTIDIPERLILCFHSYYGVIVASKFKAIV